MNQSAQMERLIDNEKEDLVNRDEEEEEKF